MTEQNSLFSMGPKLAPVDPMADPSMRRSDIGLSGGGMGVEVVVPMADRPAAITRLVQNHTALPPVPTNGTQTSAAAAVKIKIKIGKMHNRILAELAACGSHGASRQELADQLGMKIQTVCGRCGELIGWKRIKEVENLRRNGRAVLVLVK